MHSMPFASSETITGTVVRVTKRKSHANSSALSLMTQCMPTLIRQSVTDTWRAGSLAAYTQLLLVPLMARMSDPLPSVRGTASPTFAALVALVPLAQVSAHQLAADVVRACTSSDAAPVQTTKRGLAARHAVDGLQRLC